MPTVYLTNAASRRPPFRGPGRVLTIMAAPRPQYGEAGEGVVTALVPLLEWVRAAKAGSLPWEEYRDWYVEEIRHRDLKPGNLAVDGAGPVLDGDTLICACSRAAAAEGRCHRAWCAPFLAQAGWDVVLDGVALVQP